MVSCGSNQNNENRISQSLRKYLSDPTQDVKVATENLLADFLREIQEITVLQRREQERKKTQGRPDSQVIEDEHETGGMSHLHHVCIN
jgi:hypothetical protein